MWSSKYNFSATKRKACSNSNFIKTLKDSNNKHSSNSKPSKKTLMPTSTCHSLWPQVSKLQLKREWPKSACKPVSSSLRASLIIWSVPVDSIFPVSWAAKCAVSAMKPRRNSSIHWWLRSSVLIVCEIHRFPRNKLLSILSRASTADITTCRFSIAMTISLFTEMANSEIDHHL